MSRFDVGFRYSSRHGAWPLVTSSKSRRAPSRSRRSGPVERIEEHVRVVGRTHEEVGRHPDSDEGHTDAPGHLDHQDRQADRDPDPSRHDPVEARIPPVVVGIAVAGEGERVEQVPGDTVGGRGRTLAGQQVERHEAVHLVEGRLQRRRQHQRGLVEHELAWIRRHQSGEPCRHGEQGIGRLRSATCSPVHISRTMPTSPPSSWAVPASPRPSPNSTRQRTVSAICCGRPGSDRVTTSRSAWRTTTATSRWCGAATTPVRCTPARRRDCRAANSSTSSTTARRRSSSPRSTRPIRPPRSWRTHLVSSCV